MDNIYTDCLRKNSVSCVKYKLFSFVDKVLASKDSFSLTEGVTVVKNPGAVVDTQVGGTPRAAGDEDIESMVVNKVEQFLETHSLKIDLSGKDVLSAVTSAGRALGDVADSLGLSEEDNSAVVGDEGRGKKKKAAKILLPLLLALKLKAAALIPLALGAIALIAGKALLIGKIALLLAAIIGLKKLLSQQKTVTYEIVAHPHHTSSHGGGHGDAYSAIGGGGGYGGDIGGGGYGGSASGGHGGWGRSLDAQQMAYRGYPQQ
ncbi:keratin, type II cytoskeletal 1 [Anabrus simplex]|uniref:keratin, type II cytoskeletal 1 n=1 Tax=Anabrus simplex TaxID=316456 RepID=UPI0034DD178D